MNPPAVRIKVPEGLAVEDVVKALKTAAEKLSHSDGDPLEDLASTNPAAEKLARIVRSSVRQAMGNMILEMQKVLEGK